MTRAEAPGFLAHAVLMLANAKAKIDEDWDNPDVLISQKQTEEMRRNHRECIRLLKEIDPFIKACERVSDERALPLSV